jgi:hypothetical protein
VSPVLPEGHAPIATAPDAGPFGLPASRVAAILLMRSLPSTAKDDPPPLHMNFSLWSKLEIGSQKSEIGKSEAGTQKILGSGF